MNVNKFLPFLLLLPFLASCTREYKVEGVSSVTNLDGRMLYLKTLRDGQWINLDSSAVVHGKFAMKGKVDSVQMVTLYMDETSIMPLVLEKGDITVSITDMELTAKGTPLNEALYEFINKRNKLDEDIQSLGHKEARMVMDGADFTAVHAQLTHESDSLVNEMNLYVKRFISDNYETVLGPNVFMMLCSCLPYPVLTPQIDDILKDAPTSFKNNKMVVEFVNKAKENMQLIQEHQRLQQNRAATSNH